jgi:deoxyhypusine synthase
MTREPLDNAKDSIFHSSTEPNGPHVKGYDFEQPFDLSAFLNAYGTTGFQATHLKKAIDIAKAMRKDKVTIFLGYTSNMISSGVREAICYLTKNKMIDVLVTTAGGIEEDIMKCMNHFIIGDWYGAADLRQQGINRMGNILVPNQRYIEFEKFLTPILKELYNNQVKTQQIISTTDFIKLLGERINNESSILYWAQKNNIPVICPLITDGSIGDMIYFFKHEHPELKIDIADDIVTMNNLAIDAKETGAIILGGSVPKHHIMNANMMREGTKYTIYINTAHEGDGSNAGAPPEEAQSWGKQAANAASIKVEGDATILFPLLVAGAFGKQP